MTQTLLTLAPEFGGHRYGPFGAGTITFGSDTARCQIVLHSSTGALPVHAMLTATANGWTLQPAQIGAGLFLRKPNGRVVPITTAMPAEAGDAVVIGSQSGPALVISRAAAAAGPAVGAGSRIPGSQHLNKNALTNEAWRQVERAVVMNRYGNQVYTWWSRWKTGALLRPRNVIGAIVALVGFVGVGCLGCFGFIAAWVGLR